MTDVVPSAVGEGSGNFGDGLNGHRGIEEPAAREPVREVLAVSPFTDDGGAGRFPVAAGNIHDIEDPQ